MGARYDGYCADLTRTIVVGEPDEKFAEVYGTVLRAQIEAEERVRPGMTGKEIDAISRDIIADAGYGDNFGHSLGHGVGLAVHEYPRVGPTGGRRHRGRHGLHHRARHLPVRLGRRANRGHRGHGERPSPRTQPCVEDRGRRVGEAHPHPVGDQPSQRESRHLTPGTKHPGRRPPSVWSGTARRTQVRPPDGARLRRPRYNISLAAHKPL